MNEERQNTILILQTRGMAHFMNISVARERYGKGENGEIWTLHLCSEGIKGVILPFVSVYPTRKDTFYHFTKVSLAHFIARTCPLKSECLSEINEQINELRLILNRK